MKVCYLQINIHILYIVLVAILYVKMYPSSLARYRYGYSTNTRVKFVLITDSTSHHGVDSEIKAELGQCKLVKCLISARSLNLQIFKSLHQAYAETVANPFYLIGEKIHTK